MNEYRVACFLWPTVHIPLGDKVTPYLSAIKHFLFHIFHIRCKLLRVQLLTKNHVQFRFQWVQWFSGEVQHRPRNCCVIFAIYFVFFIIFFLVSVLVLIHFSHHFHISVIIFVSVTLSFMSFSHLGVLNMCVDYKLTIQTSLFIRIKCSIDTMLTYGRNKCFFFRKDYHHRLLSAQIYFYLTFVFVF